MKFGTSKYLTLEDLQSEEYKAVKEELKGYKEKDFINDICIYEVGNRSNKEILKLENVEIVKDNGTIIRWIKVIARDFENFYEINCSFYDSSNNFTITFSQK